MDDKQLRLHRLNRLIKNIELKTYKQYDNLDRATRKQLLTPEGQYKFLIDKLTEEKDKDYLTLIDHVKSLYKVIVDNVEDGIYSYIRDDQGKMEKCFM